MSSGDSNVQVVLGGKAQVVCIHDREKRLVNTPEEVARLGLLLEPPIIFNEKLHKLQRCACCDNLFFDISDDPRYCAVCNKPPTWAQRGPLSIPQGVVDE
jgi:hypothetical protein